MALRIASGLNAMSSYVFLVDVVLHHTLRRTRQLDRIQLRMGSVLLDQGNRYGLGAA